MQLSTTINASFSTNRDCGIRDISSVTTCEQYLCLRANLPNTVRQEGEGEVQCICRVNFTLDDDMDTPVYMYYSLHNYFQNHRRYICKHVTNALPDMLV